MFCTRGRPLHIIAHSLGCISCHIVRRACSAADLLKLCETQVAQGPHTRSTHSGNAMCVIGLRTTSLPAACSKCSTQIAIAALLLPTLLSHTSRTTSLLFSRASAISDIHVVIVSGDFQSSFTVPSTTTGCSPECSNLTLKRLGERQRMWTTSAVSEMNCSRLRILPPQIAPPKARCGPPRRSLLRLAP